MEFKDKICVVTGSSNGIRKSIVEQLISKKSY